MSSPTSGWGYDPDRGEHHPRRQHSSGARSKHDGQPDTDSDADPPGVVNRSGIPGGSDW
jgi:hypothetical protein